MSIRPSEVAAARKLVANVQSLIMDGGGGMGYRVYADKVLMDISGMEKVATKILASENPVLAASRFISHPMSCKLANVLVGKNAAALSAISELILVAFQAAQIAMKPKSKVKNEDVESYKYLRKLYSKGIAAIRDDLGLVKSPKKLFKDQFSGLRDYISDDYGYRAPFYLDLDDDDDEDDDDETYLEPGEDVNPEVPPSFVTPKSYQRKGQPGADASEVEEALDWAPGRVGDSDAALRQAYQEMATDPHYNPKEFSRLNYDFSGKASLELIADRMGSVVEGIQLILNRIYGQEVNYIPNPADPSTTVPVVPDEDEDDDGSEESDRVSTKEVVARMIRGDFSGMNREELIAIFNNLGNTIGNAILREANVSDGDDEDEYVVSESVTLGEDSSDEDDTIEDSDEDIVPKVYDADPSVADAGVDEVAGDSAEDTTPAEPEEQPKPMTVADQFNSAQEVPDTE